MPLDYYSRVSLMTSYCRQFKGEPEVPDPYYGGPLVRGAGRKYGREGGKRGAMESPQAWRLEPGRRDGVAWFTTLSEST